MAYYNKIGLLILNNDQTKFLVCEPGEKYTEKSVTQYLMPGGKLEEKSDVECLQVEIQEELGCEVDVDSLELVGEYTDVAATPERDVMIRLYKGNLIGTQAFYRNRSLALDREGKLGRSESVADHKK